MGRRAACRRAGSGSGCDRWRRAGDAGRRLGGRGRDGAGGRRELHRAGAVVIGVGTPAVVPAVRAEAHLGDDGVPLRRLPAPTATGALAARAGHGGGVGPERGEVVRRPARRPPADGTAPRLVHPQPGLPAHGVLQARAWSTSRPSTRAYFHGLPETAADQLRAGQDLLYKGISADTSARIYDRLYERTDRRGRSPASRYRSACELRPSASRRAGRRLAPRPPPPRRGPAPSPTTPTSSCSPPATGPRPLPLDRPPLVRRDGAGRPVDRADYRRRAWSDRARPRLFVQNAELHTHGVGAPDLGLGAHRNAVILNAVCGREVLPGAASATCSRRFGVATGRPMSTDG